MTVRIANSGSDERGKYSGGKAGDQTGLEWCVKPNYPRPWYRVLRFKNRHYANLLCDLAVEGAANDLIGYDQSKRTTFWTQLVKAAYRPKSVKKACSEDCSSGVYSLLKAVGHILGVTKLKNLPIGTTHDMRDDLLGTGLFQEFTSAKYTAYTSEYLMKGDILLKDDAHVAVVVSDGTKVTGKSQAKKPATGTYKVTATELNVREGDTVRFPIVATMKRGKTFKVTLVSENGWGYIAKLDGWACLDYARRL